MDLFEIIQKRHSYRGPFRPEPVPRTDLKRIIEAGLRAPAAYNIQTTEFVVIDEPGRLSRMGEILGHEHIRTAPAVIVCLVHDLPNPKGASFATQNYSVAAENILLAATALGYASVWMDDAVFDSAIAEHIASLVEAPPDHQVTLLIPVGIPELAKTQLPKKGFSEMARFNSYRP